MSKHWALRRISRSEWRNPSPTMPEATRGFGALAQTQPWPGVGEGLQDYAEKCRQVNAGDCFFCAMGEIDRC